MSELAKVSPGIQRSAPNPLTQLPQELVGPAGKFFAFYSDSLKGTTGLVSRLLWWMRPRDDGGEGLTAADARKALELLMRPDRAGRSDYAGQVLAALAREVEEIVKDRRAKEKAEREKRERAGRETAGSDEIRKLLEGIGGRLP